MIVVNIHEVKAKLSEYLDAVAGGERVLICKRNQPIAELRAVAQTRTSPRPIAGGPHRFDVPDAFFEPLSDEMLNEFESASVFPEPKRAAPRAAEPRANSRIPPASRRARRRP